MNDYYQNPGALRAAEERLIVVAKENEALRRQIKEMTLDYDAAVLRGRIEQINHYDKSVQQIIAADPRLQEAWDNFRVQYQLTASKELLETAREKIMGKNDGICHGCRRAYALGIEGMQEDAKSNVFNIRVLERRIAELEEKLGEHA